LAALREAKRFLADEEVDGVDRGGGHTDHGVVQHIIELVAKMRLALCAVKMLTRKGWGSSTTVLADARLVLPVVAV